GVHDLERNRAGQRHGCRDGEIDIARAKRDDEHLAQPDNDGEGREGQCGLGDADGRGAAGEQNSGKPDSKGSNKGPDPGAGEQGFHLCASLPSRRLSRSRTARTMIRIAPWAPICQSGDILRKLRKDAASVSVSAPITAPMGETRPPTNSPPP